MIEYLIYNKKSTERKKLVMDIYSFVDYFIIIAGGYLIYLTIQMRRTGEIRQNGLLSKGIDLNKAPDPAGFIRVMTPWYFSFGTAIIVCGILSVYINRFGGPQVIAVASYMVMFVFVVVFAYISVKAQNKYLKR